MGYGLAGAAAFFGSMWLVGEMEKVARQLFDRERDRLSNAERDRRQ